MHTSVSEVSRLDTTCLTPTTHTSVSEVCNRIALKPCALLLTILVQPHVILLKLNPARMIGIKKAPMTKDHKCFFSLFVFAERSAVKTAVSFDAFAVKIRKEALRRVNEAVEECISVECFCFSAR